jgi:hypothetical protein
LSNAAAAYSEAFNLADAVGVPFLRCEATTGLASVSLAAGDSSLAARYMDDVLLYLQMHALAGCNEPGWVIDTTIRVLRAVGDHRADETLRLGAELLDQRVSGLPEPLRERYINAYPERRDVLRRWLEHVGSPPTSNGSNVPLAAAFEVFTTSDGNDSPPADPRANTSSLRHGSLRARTRGQRDRRRDRPTPPRA